MSKKLLDHGLENFIYLYMAKGDQSGLEVFVSLDIGLFLKEGICSTLSNLLEKKFQYQ